MGKHRSYTVKYKLEVIDWYIENGKSLRKTEKQFKIDRKRIREWLGMEDRLRFNSKGKFCQKKKLHHGINQAFLVSIS